MATTKTTGKTTTEATDVADVPEELVPDDVQDLEPADPRTVGEKVLLKDDRGGLVIGTVIAPVDDHHVLVQAHGVEKSYALSKLKSA